MVYFTCNVPSQKTYTELSHFPRVFYRVNALLLAGVFFVLGYADERKESVCLPQEDRKILLQYKKLNAFNRKTIADLMVSLAARQ